MLLEENSLVRDVLVDDPEPFRIYRDDETVVHLAKRLQVRDIFRSRKRAGRLDAFERGRHSSSCARGTRRCSRCYWKLDCILRPKWQPLRDRLLRLAA